MLAGSMVHRNRIALVVLAAALVALVAPATSPPAAQAASVAYIDGNEVWVAALDGSRKERLSTGEGDYITVAAADNGRILAVQNTGTLAQLSRTRLWGSDGRVINQGRLPYDQRVSWFGYTAPAGLDLTSDGEFMVYGYSGFVGGFACCGGIYAYGHYAVTSDTVLNIQPIDQLSLEWPTTFGRRVIAAKQNKQPAVQVADPSNPLATTYDVMTNVELEAGSPRLHRTDVAATGRIAGLDVALDPGDDQIIILSLNGMTPPIEADGQVKCLLPTVGEASDVSFSQDGRNIAWKDDQGVKVAGAPSGASDDHPCTLASPPVVISATGKYPSIGGASVAQLRPSAAAPGPVAGPVAGPAPPPPPAAGRLTVTLPAESTAAALAGGGLPVTINVPGAGRVTITGTVPAGRLGRRGRPVVVATGTATAAGAGRVTVRLRLTKKARKYRGRLKGATLTLRVRQGASTTTQTVRLR